MAAKKPKSTTDTASSTEKLLAEANHKLEESEKRYKRLTQTVTDYLYSVRFSDGEIVETKHGPGCESVTGYTEEEFEADPSLSHRMIEDQDRPKVLQQTELIAAGKNPLTIKHRIYHKDGSLRWVSNTPIPRYDQEGALRGYDGLVRDITQRKFAEEELRKREAQYSSLVNSMSDWVWSIDLEGNHIFTNDAIEPLLGYSPKEILNTSAFPFMHPDSIPLVKEALKRSLSERQGWQGLETAWLHKDGSVRFFDCSSHLNFDESGNITGISGVARDITGRKHVEEALLESEQRHRAVVSAIPDLIFRFDENHRFVDCHAGNPALLLIPPEQFLGKLITEVLPPELAELTEKKIKATLHTGRPQSYEYSVDLPDGQHLCEGRMVACGQSQVLAIVRDITEHKQAEKEANLAHERLLSIFDGINEPVYVADPDTYELLYVNDAAMKNWGEPDSARCYEYLQDRSSPCPFCTNDKIFGEHLGNSYVWEFQNEKNKHWYRCIDKAITWPDGRMVRHELAVDFTSRVLIEQEKARIENEYRHSQKVEAIGRLAGGVAHDLNNLLSPVLAYSEILLEDFSPNDLRRKSVEEISHAGFKARDLVRQLLAFSRKQTLIYKSININEVIREFRNLLRRSIREDIKIDFVLAEKIPPINADLGQIEQVIMNLAINAQDAMPDGGKLTIETSVSNFDSEQTAEHSLQEPGEYLALSIRDTGSGIDSETAEHIFEPFFTTKGEEGTGLGLATVWGIVKQHGGTIEVKSELSQGTTFRVFIPAAKKEVAEKKVTEKSSLDTLLGSETIVLVEDNEQVRQLTDTILTRRGYKVITCKNAEEALSTLNNWTETVHLLLTDVIMPDMNGKDLFEKAKEIRPELKVLYMSGYPEDVISERNVLNENIAFIQKPFTIQALSVKVREALN